MSEPATLPPAAAPSANGPARPAGRDGEMLSRVQRLRLDGQLGDAKAGRGGGAAWLPWLLCGLLAVTWAGVAVRGYRNLGTDGETPAAGGEANPGKAAPPAGSAGGSPPQTPTPVAGTIQLEVKGYLVPARQIAVSPIEVAGRLVELNVVEGKLFQKGEVLAKIEDISYRANAAEAKAALAAAEDRLHAAEFRLAELDPKSVREIELQQVRGELQEAQAQQERAKDVFDRLSRIAGAAPQEVVQSRTDYAAANARVNRLKATLDILTQGPRPEKLRAAQADVEAAQAEVEAAQARLTQAEWRLGNCTIVAPITGTALSKKAELGNLVNPLAFAATSGSVCDIADLADLEVDLEIPERDIAKLAVGQPCRIRADAYPARLYDGRLDRIMPIANRAKSIVNVRVKVRLPDGEVPGTYLKPEMGAVVSFLPQPGR